MGCRSQDERSSLKPGRVYELHLDGLQSEDGDAVLHPDPYYTLNELVRWAPHVVQAARLQLA